MTDELADGVLATIDVLRASPLLGEWMPELYGMEIPAAKAKATPHRCVVVNAAGSGTADSGSRGRLGITTQRVDVFTYATSASEAQGMARAIQRTLKTHTQARTQSDAVVQHFTPSTGLTYLRDPDLNWPCVIQSWVCQLHEGTDSA